MFFSYVLFEGAHPPDLRKGLRACAHNGTGDGVEGRKVQCQGRSREHARYIYIYMYIYIYIYDSRWLAHFRCRFIEGVVSRATFLNGFLCFGVWFWRWGCFRSLGRL